MTVAMWVLLLVALVLANSPFLNNKMLGFVAVKRKHLGHRLLEWALGALVVAVLAYVFEAQSGPVHPKNWEFYVITITLYAVLAFPGVLYRYFWQALRKS